MPMDFPDMKSLNMAAEVHKFRAHLKDESEYHYREALADHVFHSDRVESEEIRNGVGWDQFTDEQKRAMLRRGM